MKYILIVFALLLSAAATFAEEGQLTAKQIEILRQWTNRQEIIKSVLDEKKAEIQEAEASKDKCLHRIDWQGKADVEKTPVKVLRERYAKRLKEYNKELKEYAKRFDEAAKE